MKHQKKRIFGILLSFALMLTMMPVLGLSLTAYAGTSKPIAVGTVYDVGDTIVINSKVCISLDDQQPKEVIEEVDGSYIVPKATKYDSGVGQWAFDFGEGYLWLSGNENDDVVGIKCISGNGTYESPYEFEIVVGYSLWVSGTRVTSENASNITGSDPVTASYTPADTTTDPVTPAKLTLNNFSCSESGDKNAAIYAKEDLVIETSGANNVANISTETGTRAIGVDGDLTLQGSGTLNATGGKRTIEANAVTIESGTVNTSNGDYGITASSEDKGNITINGGVVNASAEIIGLQATNDVIIKNGTVVATATGTNNDNVAIFANKNITIEGGNVEATGIVGIQAYENLMIEDGIIKATGISAGIGGLTVTINNGTIEATATGNVSFGIVGAGDGVTIIEGQVTASGSNAGIFGYVKNSIAGTGWTNVEGTEGKATIVVNENPGAELSYKKVQFPSEHAHSFTYTASGATITATCSAESCPLPPSTQGGSDHVAKLTIAAPKHTTYGDGKEAAAQITDDNSIQGEAKIKYFKTDADGKKTGDPLSAAPTDAGKYWAEITLGPEGKTATAHVVYTIAKATPTITTVPTAAAITYGQTLSNSVLEGGMVEAGGIGIMGAFTWKDGTIKPSIADSETTDYDVVFTPNDTKNYNTAECKVKLTVNQKTVGLSWAGTDLTYNGQEQAPTATATELVSGDEGKVSVTVTGGQINAGTHPATASELTGDKAGNYTLPDANTATFTISPKSISEASVTLDKTELTYNGSEQSVSVTGVSLDGKTLTADDYTVSGTTGTNKDDYTVTVTGKGNYKDSATADWKILAEAMTVKADSVSKTYDGNEYGITVEVTDPASGTKIKYGEKEGTYNLDASPKYKDAGTHTVYFKVSDNANYNDYEGSATVTIAKKAVTAKVSAEDKVYDGKTDAKVAAAVEAKDLVNGDTINIEGLKGSFANANAGEDKKVTVDSGDIKVTGTGADNYEVTIPEETTATIMHKFTEVAEVPATCEESGIKKHWKDETGVLYEGAEGKTKTTEDKLVIPAKGHKYGEWTKLDDNQHQRVCEHDKAHIEKANHSWDAGEVTKEPTTTEEGEKTFTCTICKATKTEAIPKIKPEPKPAPAKSTVKPVLVAKGIAKGKKAVNISWNKLKDADRYEIYMSKCNYKGKKYTMKKVKTVSGKTFKWTKKGLKKNTAYKFYVKALKKSGNKYKTIAKSKTAHFFTSNARSKFTNPKSLKLNKSKLTIKKGKSATIKGTVTKVKKNKKLATSHAAKLRFTSNNPSVATVNAKGKVTAKKAGTATIYVQTINGIWKTCKVTVN